jgi:hypothetical protein
VGSLSWNHFIGCKDHDGSRSDRGAEVAAPSYSVVEAPSSLASNETAFWVLSLVTRSAASASPPLHEVATG